LCKAIQKGTAAIGAAVIHKDVFKIRKGLPKHTFHTLRKVWLCVIYLCKNRY